MEGQRPGRERTTVLSEAECRVKNGSAKASRGWGVERERITETISLGNRTVSAFHCLLIIKKGLHNRLVNTTFLLHWFPKGFDASLLRDYF